MTPGGLRHYLWQTSILSISRHRHTHAQLTHTYHASYLFRWAQSGGTGL